VGLSNAQHDAIWQMYLERQTRNQETHNARYREVCEAIPEYPRLEKQLTESYLNLAKTTADETFDLKRALNNMRGQAKQKEALLVAGGFPKDYLEPLYDCPDCHDTAIYQGKKCHCYQKEAIQLLYRQSGLATLLAQENFNTFQTDFYSPNFIDKSTGFSARELIEAALKISRNFIKNFDQQHRNLYIQGSVGVGKTFLSNCIAKELLDQGKSVLYFSAAQFFDTMVKTAFERNEGDINPMRALLFECDLLIIDDLGTEYTNQATISQFFVILNERLQQKKSFVISSNISPNQLSDQYNERITSRILNNFIPIRIVGTDIRKEKMMIPQGAKK